MKKLLLPMLAVLFLLQSCGNDKKQALAFNEKLAEISRNLHSKGRDLGVELKAAMTTRDFSKVKTMCGDLQKYVDDQISNVEGTKNVAGSEKLKSTMVDFLKFEKQMIDEGFVPFGQMDANTTDEEVNTAVQNMIDKTKDETEYLSKVQDAQRDYAKKNGFKIEAQ